MTYIPNKYQQEVYNFITTGTGHAVVEAVAGSGKTTTIVQALKLIPQNQSVIFLAFNKHIATELAQKVPQNTMATTFHSLGLRTMTQSLGGRINVNNNKVYQLYFGIMENEFPQLSNDEIKSSFSPIKQLLGLLKGNLHPVTPECVEFLIDRYSITLDCTTLLLTSILTKLLELDLANLKDIDFDDMIYIPVKLHFQFQKFDWVFVDETQDLNPAQIEIVKRCLKPNGRVIAVGDRFQSIYGFRGADSDAIPNVINSLNATVLPLSITYRCPQSHVNLAKEYVPEIEAAPNASAGTLADINIETMLDQINPTDMVLCRYNAPLVRPAFTLLQQGIKVNIKGRDVGTGLLTLIKKLRPKNLDDLENKLAVWETTEKEKAEKKKRNTESIEDKYDVLMAFIDNVESIPKLKSYIKDIFSDNRSEITFSSIHKAKGLEADNIYVLQPELMPSKYATKDWELQQESNCAYVAFTRAKKALYMVV